MIGTHVGCSNLKWLYSGTTQESLHSYSLASLSRNSPGRAVRTSLKLYALIVAPIRADNGHSFAVTIERNRFIG